MSFRHAASAALLTFAVAAASPVPSSAQAGVKLTMKFKEGETYGYIITQEMNTIGEAQGQKMNTQMGQTLSIRTHIKSVDEAGNAKAEQTIDRVQMKMVIPAPVSQTIDYDTDSEEEPDNPAIGQLAKTLKNMVGEPISMTIASDGEMSDVVIPEKVKKSGAGGMGGEGQLEDMFKQSGLHLPQEEISEGHTWDQTMEVTLPFGTMVTKTTYTYNGTNDQGLHKIDAAMDIALKAADNAPIQVKAETKEASGSFLFDNKAGRLVSSKIKQVLDMEMGDIATQSITTNVTMELTDGSKKAPSRSKE